jgi:hypothetical protein
MSIVEVRKPSLVKPRAYPTSGSSLMPSTGTNILAMPIVQIDVETGNNEDWVDVLQWTVDNGSGTPATFADLDLRGIEFELMVRRSAVDNEVIIAASTLEGTMAVGAPPNIGFLIWYVPLDEVMQYKEAGSYVGDIVAMDGNFVRTVVQINLTIFEGISR